MSVVHAQIVSTSILFNDYFTSYYILISRSVSTTEGAPTTVEECQDDCPKTPTFRGIMFFDGTPIEIPGFGCICHYDLDTLPPLDDIFKTYSDVPGSGTGTGPFTYASGEPSFVQAGKWHPGPTAAPATTTVPAPTGTGGTVPAPTGTEGTVPAPTGTGGTVPAPTGGTVVATPSPTPYQVTYKAIQSRSYTDFCIGTEGGNTADGTRLHTYPCDADDDSQKWGYNMNAGLQNKKDPTKCMTMTGLNNPVVLQPCADSYTSAQYIVLHQRYQEIFAGYDGMAEYLVTPDDCTNGVTETYLIMANEYGDGSVCDTTQKWYWFNQTPPT